MQATEFVDVDERTYNMSPEALEAYLASCSKDRQTGRPLGRRTGLPIKAIVPVHLYGQAADVGRDPRVAGRYGLMVIEDAAQAQGAEYLFRSGSANDGVWRRAGSMGKAAGFSFYPGKNLGACGEAGAVTTDDEAVAQKIRMLREHGQVKKYLPRPRGIQRPAGRDSGRIPSHQAASPGRLEQLPARGGSHVQRAPGADLRGNCVGHGTSPAIVTPFEPDSSEAIYHLYVIRSRDRDAMAEQLKAKGIHTGFHYPVPVHLQNATRPGAIVRAACP